MCPEIHSGFLFQSHAPRYLGYRGPRCPYVRVPCVMDPVTTICHDDHSVQLCTCRASLCPCVKWRIKRTVTLGTQLSLSLTDQAHVPVKCMWTVSPSPPVLGPREQPPLPLLVRATCRRHGLHTAVASRHTCHQPRWIGMTVPEAPAQTSVRPRAEKAQALPGRLPSKWENLASSNFPSQAPLLLTHFLGDEQPLHSGRNRTAAWPARHGPQGP